MQSWDKFTKAYSTLVEYRKLSNTCQKFFDGFLFPVLWSQKEINYSNETIAKLSGLSVSTIEKKIRELDRAGLVVRELKRFYDNEKNLWQSSRLLSLTPLIISCMMNSLHIQSKIIDEFKKEHAKRLNELIEQQAPVYSDTKKLEPTTSADYEFRFNKRRGK